MWVSAKTTRVIRHFAGDYYVGNGLITTVYGWIDLPTAKRIAELLTRLDWKREHGGKNGV